jgi:hypothetical protein
MDKLLIKWLRKTHQFNPSKMSSSMNPKQVPKDEFVRRGLKVCASCEPFLSACETMQLHSRLSMFGVYPTSSLDDLLKMIKDFITGDGKYTIPDCLEELRSVGRHVPDPQNNSAGTETGLSATTGLRLSDSFKQQIIAGPSECQALMHMRY